MIVSFVSSVCKFASLLAEMPLKHPVAMLSLVAHYVMQRAGGLGGIGSIGGIGGMSDQDRVLDNMTWCLGTYEDMQNAVRGSTFDWKAISKGILDMTCQKKLSRVYSGIIKRGFS